MIFPTPHILWQEQDVIGKVSSLRKSLSYALRTKRQWSGLLRRTALAEAIRGSNSIEGYVVTVDDAIAAVEGEQPLEAKPEEWANVVGYRLAMTYVLQLADDPYFQCSPSLLRALHFMMLHHVPNKNPGRWRSGAIYVRNDEGKESKVVYEAPEVEKVPALMKELVESLSDSAAHPLIRGAMAHLNLAMIHPFADGNGRMARCLQTLVLAREGILESQFCSIEEWLGDNTPEYYQVLARVGAGSWHPEHDVRPWIRFVLKAHFQQATETLRRIREQEKVWNLIESEVAGRHLPDRTLLALHDAAFGHKVRNATYRTAASINEMGASRDLKLLVDAGLLIPRGEKRHRYYEAAPLIRALYEHAKEPRPRGEDPFASKEGPQLALGSPWDEAGGDSGDGS